jgi:hypothetical protein
MNLDHVPEPYRPAIHHVATWGRQHNWELSKADPGYMSTAEEIVNQVHIALYNPEHDDAARCEHDSCENTATQLVVHGGEGQLHDDDGECEHGLFLACPEHADLEAAVDNPVLDVAALLPPPGRRR